MGVAGKTWEQERALRIFENRQRRRFVRGELFTRMIAAAMILDGLFVAQEYRWSFSILFSSALAVSLYLGVRGIRGVLTVGFGVGTLLSLYMLIQGGLYFPSVPLGGGFYTAAVLSPLPAVVMVARMAVFLCSCLILLLCRDVQAFLYAQRNG